MTDFGGGGGGELGVLAGSHDNADDTTPAIALRTECFHFETELRQIKVWRMASLLFSMKLK